MNGTLYRIFNILNGKSYIGKTYSGFYKRLQQHIVESSRTKSKHRPLYIAFNKYGIDNFSAEILGEFEQGMLESKEIEYIKLYNSYGKGGYNATLGGDGSRTLDIEEEKLISLYLKTKNISTVSKEFSIAYATVEKILKAKNIEIIPYSSDKKIKPRVSKKVRIIEVDIVFIDAYECATFLLECDLVSSSSTRTSIADCIRKVCNGGRPHYLGLCFEYVE